MVRFPLFFLAAGAAALAMVGAALAPLIPKTLQVVEARQDKGILILDGPALAQLSGDKDFPVTPAPGPRADQDGPRLASFVALTDSTSPRAGVRLKLGPKTQAALKGRPLTLLVSVRPVEVTGAQTMAIGYVIDGAQQSAAPTWARSTIGASDAPLRFDLGSPRQNVSALAIWPAVEGQGRGIELVSIALVPTPARAPAPSHSTGAR
ncbi:MAG: hypothetical protein RL186_1317 [Pseudomonadota bacterium]